jgi:thiol-disulfide isomerase/thioredoxin
MNRSILLILFISCLRTIGSAQSLPVQPIIKQSQKTSHDLMAWLTYEKQNIFWYADYTSYDTNLQPIDKVKFLETLSSGQYLPIRVGNIQQPAYMIAPMDDSVNTDVRNTIMAKSSLSLTYTRLEGTPLPAFSFTDINGKQYSNQSLMGKYVVINCWFISCSPCVKEIPELNQLVKKYKNNQNIVFLAIGFDGKQEITDFNKEKKFAYNLVYDGKNYLQNNVGIASYPTHIFIDKAGLIKKIVPADVQYILPLIENAVQE